MLQVACSDVINMKFISFMSLFLLSVAETHGRITTDKTKYLSELIEKINDEFKNKTPFIPRLSGEDETRDFLVHPGQSNALYDPDVSEEYDTQENDWKILNLKRRVFEAAGARFTPLLLQSTKSPEEYYNI